MRIYLSYLAASHTEIYVLFSLVIFFESFPFIRNFKRKDNFIYRVLLSTLFIIIAPFITSSIPFLYNSFIDPRLPSGLLSNVLRAFTVLLNYIALMILLFGEFHFLFDEHKSTILLCLVNAHAAKQLSEDLHNLLFLFIQRNYEAFSFVYYLVLFAFYLITQRLLWIFSNTKNSTSGMMFPVRESLFLCIALLLPSMFLNILSFSYGGDKGLYMCFLLLGATNAVLALYVINYYSERIQTAYELQLERSLWEEREKQLILSREDAELISIKYHDLRHHINTLKDQLPYSKKALDELDESIERYDSIVETGNHTLDSLLTSKNLECERNNIKFSIMADGTLINNWDSVDIISFFSNAIENAINATLELSPENRSIKFNLSKKGFTTVFSLENTCKKTDFNYVDGLPVSQNKDRKNHGFGMKSMRKTAKKYGGTISVSTEGSIFGLYAIFP